LAPQRLHALRQAAAHPRAVDQGRGPELDDQPGLAVGLLASQLLSDAVHDAGLADPGGPDQARVVAEALAEHVEHALDLGVAADAAIELAASRRQGEVVAEARQQRELLARQAEAPLELVLVARQR